MKAVGSFVVTEESRLVVCSSCDVERPTKHYLATSNTHVA